MVRKAARACGVGGAAILRPDAERPGRGGGGPPRAWLPGVLTIMIERRPLIEASGSALDARRVGVASGRRLSRAIMGDCVLLCLGRVC